MLKIIYKGRNKVEVKVKLRVSAPRAGIAEVAKL